MIKGGQKSQHLKHMNITCESGFFPITARHIELCKTSFFCGNRKRQSPVDGAQRSIKRKFAEKQFSFRIKFCLSRDQKIRKRDGQIKRGSFFFKIRGRK